VREQLYIPLSDGDLTLEPLAEAHRDVLRDACAADPDIWQIYASNFGPPDFDRSFDALIGHAHRMPYVIIAGGAVAGMTAFLRPDWSAETVEIGNTYLAPAHRGTGLNARVKALLLGHAFAVGIRRIEFRIDERNGRSQAAVLKLGAIKEGVLRAERVTWTGHVRDTGLFSLLAADWMQI
jgi:RimJ/RimL family protein N-acetyltransferase